MYKLLLCWRYLRTRYIALASIISVTLGVATMVVVNSVMAGFSNEMHIRLHSILSDITFESPGLDGFYDPESHMAEIRDVVGDDLEGMTPSVRVPAMMHIEFRGETIPQQIMFVGIDEATYAEVSDFAQYMQHPENREKISFLLREGDYAERLPAGGWKHRRERVRLERAYLEELKRYDASRDEATGPGDQLAGEAAADPFTPNLAEQPGAVFDEMNEQFTGVILGIAAASVRRRNSTGDAEDFFFCLPGDDVEISFPSTGSPPRPLSGRFTIVDLYESKMSEYDSSFAFVPIKKLQELRGMIHPLTGVSSVTAIQIRLKPGADLNAVRDKLRARFPADRFPYRIQTWKDMQGPLLAAVQMETMLLNILLFLIIAVAGFGILATFFMIVVEKTRDIGILKSLGAPSSGVMSIFISYGLLLGAVGAGAGMALGLLFVANINHIAHFLEFVSGREVFDPTVYYFQEIPTIIDPFTVAWIVAGAIAIAIAASVLPALRAARLHPVEALRYE